MEEIIVCEEVKKSPADIARETMFEPMFEYESKMNEVSNKVRQLSREYSWVPSPSLKNDLFRARKEREDLMIANSALRHDMEKFREQYNAWKWARVPFQYYI